MRRSDARRLPGLDPGSTCLARGPKKVDPGQDRGDGESVRGFACFDPARFEPPVDRCHQPVEPGQVVRPDAVVRMSCRCMRSMADVCDPIYASRNRHEKQSERVLISRYAIHDHRRRDFGPRRRFAIRPYGRELGEEIHFPTDIFITIENKADAFKVRTRSTQIRFLQLSYSKHGFACTSDHRNIGRSIF